MVLGQILYGFSLYQNNIAPGYLNVFDFQVADLVRLKFWTHIDSYFLGILLAFLYEKFKYFRFKATKEEKEVGVLRIIDKTRIIDGTGSPAILITTSLVLFVVSIMLHSHIEIFRPSGMLNYQVVRFQN